MGDVVGQGSGWFITERVVVSTRHTFWKEDMKSAAYSKVLIYISNREISLLIASR